MRSDACKAAVGSEVAEGGFLVDGSFPVGHPFLVSFSHLPLRRMVGDSYFIEPAPSTHNYKDFYF